MSTDQTEPVRALDEEGQEYELGPEFTEALRICIREQRISWKVHHGSKTLAFGPGLNSSAPKVVLPGEVSLDLSDPANIDTLNGLADDDDSNDGWWRPKE